ncbi:MFS transporter [Amycolatopsis sp. NPDC059021]|uniref:MFS transporter n=1 Tax=Amycolatopsis sp. NPDC059021 TaxID=3346704 RepID=UPI00366E1670
MTVSVVRPGKPRELHRYLVPLAVLYSGQFIATGVIAALPALLRQRGASLGEVGAISLVSFATVAKIFWAPLVDRYGRYRSWLAFSQPAVVLTLAVLAALDLRGDFPVVFLAACVLIALVGTQDIATDALAVRLSGERERGAVNAIRVGAGFAGAIVGTSATLIITQHWGWPWAATVVAAAGLVPLLVLRRLPGPAATPRARHRPGLAEAARILRRPGTLWWMGAILPLAWGGIMLAQSLLAPMLVDQGWDLAWLSLLTSVLPGTAGIAGAAVAGRAMRRYSRRRTLLFAIAGEVVAMAALLPVAFGRAEAVTFGAVVVLGAIRGVTNTVIFTVSMDLCRTATAGSDFTLFSSWGYTIAIGAASLGPVLAGAWGYPATILAAVALTALSLFFVCTRFPLRQAPTPAGITAAGLDA